MRGLCTMLGILLVTMTLCSPPTSAAKVIELWRLRKDKPPEKTAPPGEGKGAETEGTESETEEATADEEGAGEEPREEVLPAKILREAAHKNGLTAAGEIGALSAEDLLPPAEGEEAAQVAIPAAAGAEPFEDYDLVALAGGEFTRSEEQTVRAAVFEFATASDAWGLFSRHRGEKVLRGVGQAANFGRELRLWRGRFAAVLSADPPDKRMDEVRLTKLGRAIAAMIPGPGRPPEMVGWLPSPNQITDSLFYFHADGPLSSDTLGLTDQTEGVAAEYRIGKEIYGGVIVRYPDREAVLEGWSAFVRARTGRDPDTGVSGSRRTGLLGGRWNAARVKGRVCAFVIGAATRNQAEILIAQALARAHD